MGPEDKAKLYSTDPKERREQERSEVFAKSKRLIAECTALRARAKELQHLADDLIAQFRRDHPDG